MLIVPPVLALLVLAHTLEESRAFVVPRPSSSPPPPPQSYTTTTGGVPRKAGAAAATRAIDSARQRLSKSKSSMPSASSSPLALHFFPRRREEAVADPGGENCTSEDGPASAVATTTDPDDDGDDKATPAGSSSLPNFFARRFGGGGGGGGGSSNDENRKDDVAAPATAADAAATAVSATRAAAPAEPPAPRSPEEEAQRLRAEAGRVRLEAERMDAELTLQKIERLERQITSSKKKLKPEELEAMQNQLQALQTKLFKMDDDDDDKNDHAKSSSSPPKNGTSSGSSSTSSSASTGSMKSSTTMASTTEGPLVMGGELPALLERQRALATKEIEETSELLDSAPDFLKKIMAAATDYEYGADAAINTTELILVLTGLQVPPDKPPPVFTRKQLADREERLRNNPDDLLGNVKDLMDEEEAANATKVALLTLEFEYYYADSFLAEGNMEKVVMKNLEKNIDKLADEPWLAEVLNMTATDATIGSLFPKCMRDQGPEPTEAAVRQLVEDLKSDGLFVATQKPDKVSGGYLVRGQSKKATGDELMRSIDSMLERKLNLKGSLNVFYTQDFGALFDSDELEDAFDPDEVPPILYITGPNIVRPPRPLQLSLVSAAGLATSWYLAIYPFLLNPAIAKRVEDQLALADAGMTPDLNWLSELSLPLFFTFVGLQLIGEAGQQAVAAANKVKLSVPTFVPSLITGVTSTVTTFKTPPPNKTAMFDIAVAGPLLGIVASLAAVAVGSSMTLTADASLLPALPLEILRQSTLGGGIINSILGNGALSIPEGAQGTAAVAGITIPLHPVAVAGYISLIVNALSLLPIGTTDGGRMALAVFGRAAKLLIGNIFLTALFVVGILGSDLFLFYFGFITLFQTGNEIPAKNEVDKVEFSRVIMAIAAYVLMVLTLTPFQ